jgi:hypothetical protein
MSALSSCFIANYLNKKTPSDEFILCIEQGSHVLHSYYEIVDLIAEQGNCFNRIVRSKVEFKVISLRNPFKYIQNILYYKNIAKLIKIELDLKLSSKKIVLWAPTTSRLWQFFKKKDVSLNVIEHGLGEYVSASNINRYALKPSVSSILTNFFGYPSLSCYDKIWLCSNAVLINPSEKVCQINFSTEFKAFADKYWCAYKKLFPVAADELSSIAIYLKNHDGPIFFYLPSDEVRSEMQAKFIIQQMGKLQIAQNALFIIKNHPSDINYPYWRLLKPYGKCINITNEYNCYSPVEFITVFLQIKNIIGSASSALFYLKSWAPEINTMIYNDYDKNMLIKSCKNLKDHLHSAGLLNNP